MVHLFFFFWKIHLFRCNYQNYQKVLHRQGRHSSSVDEKLNFHSSWNKNYLLFNKKIDYAIVIKVIISVLKIIFKAALTIEQDTFSYFTIFNIKTIKQLNLKKNLLKLIVLESINSLESISLLFFFSMKWNQHRQEE